MNVLFVASQAPNPTANGGAQRLYHHVRALASRHDVTLAFVAAGPDIPPSAELNRMCKRVVHLHTKVRRLSHNGVGLPPATRLVDLVRSPRPRYIAEWRAPDLTAQLRTLRAEARVDATWVARAYMASVAGAAGIRADVVDVDDIDSEAFGRRLDTIGSYRSRPIDEAERIKIRAYEWALTFRHRAVVVCKEEDRRFFAHPARCHVVPNGADIPADPGLGEPPQFDFLFLGTMSYWPNIDAARWFANSVLPIIRHEEPAASFCVAGRSAASFGPQLAHIEGCRVVSDPVEVADVYHRANVVVVPMRQGSGTCIKTIEALGFEKPLVVTPQGSEGLGLIDGQQAMIAGDASRFARACISALRERDSSAAMAQRGRRYVLDRFDWDTCAGRAVDLLEAVAHHG